MKRFSTGTHEVLHAHSVGLFEPGIYESRLGYEEGVVEQTMRLIRDQVLSFEFAPGSVDFSATDADNVYNGYIDRLEQLRGMTRRDARSFYMELLRTPLADREETILQWIAKDSGLSPPDARLATQVQRAVLRNPNPPATP